MDRPALKRLALQLEAPIGLLALLVVPAILMEEHGAAPELQRVALS